jgi:formate dehydrogenase subunit gamma
MQKSHARHLGALITGLALALPFGAEAQTTPAAPAAAPAQQAQAQPAAPKAPAAPQAEAPKAASPPPVPAAGSTAVPGWNKAPESWDASSERPQYASIPGAERNRLIQGAGREWRAFRNGPLTRYGGYFFAVVLAVLTVFYLTIGPLKVHGQPTGRLIERFNAVERASHWLMAFCFVALALTGIVILWGKHIILPWLGYTGFSWLTIISKNAHNFVGPLFIFSLVLMFLLYVKDNLPAAHDIDWLKKAGGMFGGPHVPSGKFNAGEKIWFWLGIGLLGAAVSVTGVILDFPNWNQVREIMQEANVVHAVCAIFFVGISFGHMYLGTLGVPGAYGAMHDGYVDESWAKEHHEIWYNEVKANKRPEKFVAGAAQPVPGDD